jgi:SOS-response transcriptional repressor LexA
MTPQQKVYFDALERYIKQNGCSPSYEEIGKMVGVTSLGTIAKMVDRLVRDGYIVKGTGSSRNLAIVPAKLHGFNICDRNHEQIWFLSTVCPLCTEIQKNTPPRMVAVNDVF